MSTPSPIVYTVDQSALTVFVRRYHAHQLSSVHPCDPALATYTLRSPRLVTHLRLRLSPFVYSVSSSLFISTSFALQYLQWPFVDVALRIRWTWSPRDPSFPSALCHLRQVRTVPGACWIPLCLGFHQTSCGSLGSRTDRFNLCVSRGRLPQLSR